MNRPGNRELCTMALGQPIWMNDAERILIDVIALDEN